MTEATNKPRHGGRRRQFKPGEKFTAAWIDGVLTVDHIGVMVHNKMRVLYYLDADGGARGVAEKCAVRVETKPA